MKISIKSIVLGTALAALVGSFSVNAEVVKKVTVKQGHAGVHRVIVVHPVNHKHFRHHHRHHNDNWRHHHRDHRDHWRHHHRHHH